MTIKAELRERVRQRAGFCCEFCGVTEGDAGGELSVDHYQPASVGGKDDFENLVYSRFRCNLYKADYWPRTNTDPELWCPRREPADDHFILLENGNLNPISKTGEFTLKRLRLNRSQLVAYRLAQWQSGQTRRALERYRKVVEILERLHQQQAELVQEQGELLEEQRRLLALLLGDDND